MGHLLFDATIAFVGLLMLLEPSRFTPVLGQLVEGIQRFENALKQRPYYEFDADGKPAHGADAFIRFVGAVVVAGTLAHLAAYLLAATSTNVL